MTATMMMMEETAKQWIADEVQRRSELPGGLPCKLQLSPASWVLPKLLRIIYCNTQQPIEVLGPLIRKMLVEQAFASTGGSPCECEQLDRSVDETVSILVRVLERVRRHHLTQEHHAQAS